MITILNRLRKNCSGIAMTEFAMSLPFLLTAGLWGSEEANLAMAHMQANQLAIHIADNMARIGDTSTLENRKIYESDIIDVLQGSDIESKSLRFFEHGRVIISSLEVDPSNRQYIHWQRCMGMRAASSSYGGLGVVAGGVGLGPPGEEVSAPADGAVIFVELTYDYQPLISKKWVGTPTITTTASFMVRDSRDLSQIYQRNPSAPDLVADCSIFSKPPAT